jgi:hypothetical protein
VVATNQNAPSGQGINSFRTVSDRAPERSGVVNHSASSSSASHSQQQQQQPRFGSLTPLTTRIVPRPVPRAQVADPRGFQIQQLHRRYSPSHSTLQNGTTELVFKLIPSDPDFPFELTALDCSLRVPANYPQGRPSLKVTNREMGRGYQINVEDGFDEITQRNPEGTLLQWLNALDRDLEKLLSAPMAKTVKIIPNAGSKKDTLQNEIHGNTELLVGSGSTARPRVVPISTVVQSKPMYSSEQLENARARRASETRQLEARLSRLPLFSKSTNGTQYTIPIEPRQRERLPASIQAIKVVNLIVPEMYNLEPCKIEVSGIEGKEVLNLQENFKTYATRNTNASLFAMVNLLAQNMNSMIEPSSITPDHNESTMPDIQGGASHVGVREPIKPKLADNINDKSHIIVIPRPPEWAQNNQADEDSDSDSLLSFDSEDNEEGRSGDESHAHAQINETSGPERGILMSFPHLELYGIELLELVTLSITVKCARCKETTDVNGIHKLSDGDISALKNVVCKKCSNQMGIGLYLLSYMSHTLDTPLILSARVSYGFNACKLRESGIPRLGWVYCSRHVAQVCSCNQSTSINHMH